VRIAGGITPAWTATTARLYKSNARDVVTVKNIKTAEAAKVIENIQRDLNIGVYYSGAGVGGHCLPVDPYYLVHKADPLGCHSRVITVGRAINDSVPLHVVQLVIDALNERERAVRGSKIAVLGLSYKENVGDYRESATAVLIEELIKRGARVHLIDPYVEEEIVSRYATPETKVYDALEAADALVLITAHADFLDLDLINVKDVMRTPIIVDGRRVFDPEMAAELGFVYRGVGAANR
jgi:UDP-N-acetyl-D-mannosaminuronate dehydrogenase